MVARRPGVSSKSTWAVEVGILGREAGHALSGAYPERIELAIGRNVAAIDTQRLVRPDALAHAIEDRHTPARPLEVLHVNIPRLLPEHGHLDPHRTSQNKGQSDTMPNFHGAMPHSVPASMPWAPRACVTLIMYIVA